MVSQIFVAATTRSAGVISSPAMACRQAVASLINRRRVFSSGYLDSTLLHLNSSGMGNLNSCSTSTILSVEPELAPEDTEDHELSRSAYSNEF